MKCQEMRAVGYFACATFQKMCGLARSCGNQPFVMSPSALIPGIFKVNFTAKHEHLGV